MLRQQLDISVRRFIDFEDVIRRACGAPESWVAPRQVGYLRSYLRGHQLGPAQTIIVEHPYVDRHYLEEYAAYYARTLTPPAAHATRVHVFRSAIELEQFHAMLAKAAGDDQAAVEAELNHDYLGYITVRPIASAPIGRTVLAHYGVSDDRSYDPAMTVHTARLCGLELRVQSLPFQQQDRAVGACATTAAWTALSRVARAAGGRAPAPFAVTAAATKHLVSDRDLPAVGGLELSQLTTAVRELGFTPYTVKPADADFASFAFTLKVYLRSGIPAVLYLSEDKKGGYHAVTVAGYKCSGLAPLEVEGPKGSRLLTSGLTRLYVHDDCIGPYVKMSVEPPSEQHFHPTLVRVPVDADRESSTDVPPGTMINFAIFPLYPKLRLSAADLIAEAGALVPLFNQLVGPAYRDCLSAECWFAPNGEYLRDLFHLGVKPPARVAEFAARAVLSRHVGIIRWFLSGRALADVICDTTDIGRDHPAHGGILAVLPFPGNLVDKCRRYLSDIPGIVIA